MSVPFTAVQFSVYESLKTLMNPDGTYSPITHVMAGGVAGGVAAAVTTPLDVAKVGYGSATEQKEKEVKLTLGVKTLLQTRGSSNDPRIRQARGMAEALRIIRDRDGLRGIRRGMLPRVLTVAPSTAISWMSYEFFSELAGAFLMRTIRIYVSGLMAADDLVKLSEVLIRQGGTLPETGQQV